MQFSRPFRRRRASHWRREKSRISWNLVREIHKQLGSPQQPPQSESNRYRQMPKSRHTRTTLPRSWHEGAYSDPHSKPGADCRGGVEYDACADARRVPAGDDAKTVFLTALPANQVRTMDLLTGFQELQALQSHIKCHPAKETELRSHVRQVVYYIDQLAVPPAARVSAI
jgi:hypothetical protein